MTLSHGWPPQIWDGKRWVYVKRTKQMPASKFTKKATTPKLKRQWQHVEDSMKARGASPGAAVRAANAAVKRSAGKRKK